MRAKRTINDLGAGPMADIAFLLLIFFLITTTFDIDQGIPTRLTPLNGVRVPSSPIKINVLVNKNDQIMADGSLASHEELSSTVYSSLTRHGHQKVVVSITNDRETTYSAYVLVYDAIRKGYAKYRDDYSVTKFGRSFKLLDEKDKQTVIDHIPVKISEVVPEEFSLSGAP